MLIDNFSNFIEQQRLFTSFLAVTVVFFCERQWNKVGLLSNLVGRLFALTLIVVTANYLFWTWNIFYLNKLQLLCALAISASHLLVWFVRGYGFEISNEAAFHPWSLNKQRFFGLLVFLSILTISLRLDPSIYWFEKNISIGAFFFWVTKFLWGAVCAEAGITYSDFSSSEDGWWNRLIIIQGTVAMNSFLWGNQLRDFIVTQLHPNLVLACVGFCSLTAVYSMGQQFYAYLKN